MRYHAIGFVLVGFVAACSSPHPHFMGVQMQVIEVRGSTFQIRIKGEFAEAIRTNFEYVPKIGDIFPKATEAMEIASGCTVVPDSINGDPALMVAKLKCDYSD